MNTYHIHIGGLVQGVGFRPFVCRMAARFKMNGWVSNGNDGVHIECNSTENDASVFLAAILSGAPRNAIIRNHSIRQVNYKQYTRFSIHASDATAKPDMLLAPDIAICSGCKKEIADKDNRRYQYPFTTCLECGPRYSITTSLPYDRENTTMNHLAMCSHCQAEYDDIRERRHYSQTNSCPNCTIPIHLYDNNGTEICSDFDCILILLLQALKDGHIIAVKGIGGYLLMCDATRPLSIETLRDRKHRQYKPFAVMYPSVEMMKKDVVVTAKESEALQSNLAPIVLCSLKATPLTGLSTEAIAPGLDKMGVMLPYTPLLQVLLQQWNKPLIATSGNLSGSPIIYKDEDALMWLTDYADFIISFEREIVAPQDDSLLQFTPGFQQQIILRRSRGMAPNYFPALFHGMKNELAMGAELKSAFAITAGNNVYISQYLGDQVNYESQVSFNSTLAHLQQLLKVKPAAIYIDSHPNYFVSQLGLELGEQWKVPVHKVQHHQAHFAAVLAENNLLMRNEAILGVVWDGTGYGDDGQVWGGEFFLLEDNTMERFVHLDYFPQLMGDKMSREPRVSAVSLLRNNMEQLMLLKDLFTVAEREFYIKLLQQQQHLLTSSMGRLLDGIAAILKIQSFNTYEGEAAMKLEAAARQAEPGNMDSYPFNINRNRLNWMPMLHALTDDMQCGTGTAAMARKVFVTLALMVKEVAARARVKKIAFSGGVFQNALLADLLQELLKDEYQLYFHRQLSPNDECIGFGQLAYAALQRSRNEIANREPEILEQ